MASSQQKKAFQLRLSPEMLQALEVWARDELRSVNGQIEYVLQQALIQQKRFRQRPQHRVTGNWIEQLFTNSHYGMMKICFIQK